MLRETAKKYIKDYPLPFLRTYTYKYPKHNHEPAVKYGVLVAVCKDEELYFGWALCNPKDKFDKHVGCFIALKRAESQMGPGAYFDGYPEAILDEMYVMDIRSHKYFKQVRADD
jgi:hypothetical protein